MGSATDDVKDSKRLPAVPLQHGFVREQNKERGDTVDSFSTSSPSASQGPSSTVEEGAEKAPGQVASNPNLSEIRTMDSNTQGPEADTGLVHNGLGQTSTSPIPSVDTRRVESELGKHPEALRLSPLGNSSPNVPTQSPSPNDKSSPLQSDGPQLRALPPVSPLSPRTRGGGFSLRRSILTRSMNDKTLDGDSSLELQPTGNSTTDKRSLTFIDEDKPSNKSGARMKVSYVKSDAQSDTTSPKEIRTLRSLPHYESWVRNRRSRPDLLVKLHKLGEDIRKKILRIHEIPPSKDGRHLNLDIDPKETLIDERTGRPYTDNLIRSCRYTLWNFLPRQLFAQFSKLANFYFLCVSILQMIPGLSTTGNYTTIVPLTFFVILSMAKEGYDDLRRYRLDRVENNQSASVLQASTRTHVPNDRCERNHAIDPEQKVWVKKKWKDVDVGDVVKLVRNEAAPADLVLLHSNGANGIAYIETMAMDGETNLKSKQALPCLARNCQSVDAIAECNAHFVVEDPNLDFYRFEGRCTVEDQTLPLTNNEIIYRGSILRNTPELCGMVIYSGEECKIRMNATKNPRIKAPALQTVVNRVVIIIVLFVFALAIFNTAAYQIWVKTTEKKAWYLVNAKVAFIPILSSFIILFNTMIPLSLYVSLEIVKLCQLYLMNDIAMYDEVSDTPMEARTSTINEELGQVKYANVFDHQVKLMNFQLHIFG